MQMNIFSFIKTLPLLLLLLLLFHLDQHQIQCNDDDDFRYVSFNETLRNGQIYQDGDENFDAILVDPQRDQIIIGAKNAIIRLSLHKLQLLEKFRWESSTNDINTCRNQLRSIDQCDNFIRVLALRTRDQLLLTCGTNAYRPICTWRRPDSLSTLIPNENFLSADGKSPYNSRSPIAYDLIDTGEFYSATSNEPMMGVTDPLIQRSFSDGKQLRTQQHDSNWLRNPQFVRILDIGPFVYTFFREIALEHLSCGTNIYSRVARVCKFDDGTMKFSDTFRSFSKIRFLCTKKLANEITSFDYNELQSVYFDRSKNLIYGAFNLPKSGLPGSAVCIYTVDQLQRAFSSSFLTQKTNESFWLPSSVKQDVETCDKNPSTNEIPLPSGPVLRSGVLQSSFDALTFDHLRISHLLIDYIDDVTILFVITFDDLTLRKYSLLSNQQLCLLEHLQLKSNSMDENFRVNKAELISERKEILITTDRSVLKLSVARCDRYRNNNECLSAMDPYCQWNSSEQRCVLYVGSSSTFSSSVSRRLLTCPILNSTIDGGWTSWSSWFNCEQTSGEKCQCRTRTCEQPKPKFGGRICQGSNIEINQCEVHGGWSSWSDWTECPKTCGKAVRSRKRTCSNPEPKNNGRLCVGAEREEETCPEIICSGQTARLSAWTDWDKCSKTCGGGIQKRRRTCTTTDQKCNECLEETRLCNETPCRIEETELWSDWTPVDKMSSDGSTQEKRIRYVCSIDTSNDQMKTQLKLDKTLYRVCLEGKTDCRETDSLDNLRLDDWSPWSTWSECFPSCSVSGSIETRRRSCLGKYCPGNDFENRSCLTCSSSSSLKSNWSCWTEWSDCSPCSSTRIRSMKFRTRTCLTDFCHGESREERLCSICPVGLSIDSLNERRFALLHLIFVGLCSFLFGCFLTLCLFVCFRRFRRHRHQSNTFLHTDYFQASTSNSSSSPQTTQDSETFATLSTTNHHHQTKFRSFDSSSSSTTTGGASSTVSAFLKEIPSRKLNMYINPREMPPLPPAATLKRTSLMSSMKTNLDADDL